MQVRIQVMGVLNRLADYIRPTPSKQIHRRDIREEEIPS
jgi:hypothetical protein